MTVVTIEKKICLESKYLDSKIHNHLLFKLQLLLSSECTKDTGHIINVTKIINIISHEIDRANCSNVFFLRFEAEALKPDTGMVLTGDVCMVYKDGIFLEVLKGRQKMLVPKLYLKEYTFDESVPCYRNGDDIIKAGDVISAMVTASQYNNKTFSCFGSIV